MSIYVRKNSTRVALGAFGLVATLALAALGGVGAAHAAGEPGDAEFLDSAEDFVIIAAAEITETDGSVVVGDVALYTGTAQELLPSQVDGEIHTGTDAVGGIAMDDATAAYNTLALAPVTDAIVANLAGQIYLAGVYNNATSLLLDGTMTIHGASADDVFIFQAATETLTVMANSTVNLTGLAQACNVYWQVGSSATIGVNSTFVGTVIAYSSIAAQTGADIEGRLIALTGAVTLDNNYINSQTTCVRTSTAGTVTTTTTREAGDVTVTVVDSATPPATPTETTPTTTAATGVTGGSSRRPTTLQNTGSLPNTGVDLSVPLISVGLMLLLGLALVAAPRTTAARED